jgi:hypothetical protein
MRICIGCGCTDRNACMTADGLCRWAALDPPLCSACADGGFDYADEAPPGPLLCAHSFLYVDPVTARCVHCGELKIDGEAA